MYGSWMKTQQQYKKQLFKQKFKSRVKSSSFQPTHTLPNQPQTAHSHQIQVRNTPRDDKEFRRTVTELTQSNFCHHQPQLCLCQECNCGRHLCKIHTIKPDLTKSTIYNMSYQPQKVNKSLIVVAKEYQKLKGPHLDMKTTYHNQFTERKADSVEKYRPSDSFSMTGPAQEITSYSAQYPGHRGQNQYVKPTDRHTRGQFPLRCKSTYSRSYVNRPATRQEFKYRADQLKTGYDWLGSTTYDNCFAQPNPEYHAQKVKVVEKKDQQPGDRMQFSRTTYGSEFRKKGSVICPAKKELLKCSRGSFSEHKDQFTQNCDFKSLSKKFQAFSTSKNA